jgi:hypothetical protein
MLSPSILNLLQDCEDPPLTPETLEELEIVLGVRFPRDYAEFLLKFNGGAFYREVFVTLPIAEGDLTRVMISEFFGEPNDGIEGGGLTYYTDLVQNQLSEEYVPIADAESCYVVMKLARPAPKIDGIWYFNQEAYDDQLPLQRLADSFTAFLSLLEMDVCDDEEEQENLPLFQAIERGGFTAIERYLAEGGNPNKRNQKGQTLLTAAVIYRWPQIVRLLLAHSADSDARDRQGRTPLHHAARCSIDSVKLLLAAGADPKARDKKGKSVLAGWSYRANQILRAHGAEE